MKESLLFSILSENALENFNAVCDKAELLFEIGLLNNEDSISASILWKMLKLGKPGIIESLDKCVNEEKYCIIHYIPDEDILITSCRLIDNFNINEIVCVDNKEVNQAKFDLLKNGEQIMDPSYRLQLHHALHIKNKEKDCLCYKRYKKYLDDNNKEKTLIESLFSN